MHVVLTLPNACCAQWLNWLEIDGGVGFISVECLG